MTNLTIGSSDNSSSAAATTGVTTELVDAQDQPTSTFKQLVETTILVQGA